MKNIICMDKAQFDIRVSGCAPLEYPTDLCYGLLWYDDDEALEIPKKYPYRGEWGDCLSDYILLRNSYPMPYKLSILWLSIVEKKYYIKEEDLPQKLLAQYWEHHPAQFSHIIVGMAPYGVLSLWFYGEKKSVLLAKMYANEVTPTQRIEIENSLPISTDNLCKDYLDKLPKVKELLETKGLPPTDLFDRYMQQFTYRYLPLFEKWEDEEEVKWHKYEEDEIQPEFEYIEEALFDGTFDKLHDDNLLKYHEAGKPKKLTIKWHIKKSEYSAYFWFDNEKICSIFERFYGVHPDTKTDFIVRIDAEKKKYELSLFRQGLKEPLVIPEETYQLLVFKNKYEDYRSKNYNQERGAWVW
ncbi:MAG: DUF2931 family protein [Alistipes sp.]|nr:DUF2931 family protein [Alistipes sp.]